MSRPLRNIKGWGELTGSYLDRSSARGVNASIARSSGTAGRESDASSSERNASSRVALIDCSRGSSPRATLAGATRACVVDGRSDKEWRKSINWPTPTPTINPAAAAAATHREAWDVLDVKG